MPTKKLALERGGPKKLQLRWGWRRNFEVAIDGASWTLDRPALEAGASLTLPDGSGLFVQRVRRRWWSIARRDEVTVERDGVPVPGSDGDPRVIGRAAASLIAFFGLLPVLFVGTWLVFSRNGPEGAFVVAAYVLLVVPLAVLAALGVRLAVAIGAGLVAVPVVAAVVMTGGRAIGIPTLFQLLVVVHLVESWKRMRPRRASPRLASVFE